MNVQEILYSIWIDDLTRKEKAIHARRLARAGVITKSDYYDFKEQLVRENG